MLQTQVWGAGPRVVFIHGGIADGPSLWTSQRPLAARWRMEIVNRRGYGESPATDREDFEVDAKDIAEHLGDGAHLVGHSYGAVGALLAASIRPNAVCSLTVIEPPVFRVAKGNPDADSMAEQRIKLHASSTTREPTDYAQAFFAIIGDHVTLPSPLPPSLDHAIRLLMNCRGPWEAEVPVRKLWNAPFPKLVVSGGHHRGLEAICDVLERAIGADRAVLKGAGHSVPRIGSIFNETLEQFLLQAQDNQVNRSVSDVT